MTLQTKYNSSRTLKCFWTGLLYEKKYSFCLDMCIQTVAHHIYKYRWSQINKQDRSCWRCLIFWYLILCSFVVMHCNNSHTLININWIDNCNITYRIHQKFLKSSRYTFNQVQWLCAVDNSYYECVFNFMLQSYITEKYIQKYTERCERKKQKP